MNIIKQKEIDSILFEDLIMQINQRINSDNVVFVTKIEFYFDFSNVQDWYSEEVYEYSLFLYLLTGRSPNAERVLSRLQRGKRYYSVILKSPILKQKEIFGILAFLRIFISSELCDLVSLTEHNIIFKTDKIHDVLNGFKLSSSFYTKQLYKSLYIKLEFNDVFFIDWILNLDLDLDNGDDT